MVIEKEMDRILLKYQKYISKGIFKSQFETQMFVQNLLNKCQINNRLIKNSIKLCNQFKCRAVENADIAANSHITAFRIAQLTWEIAARS